LNRNVTASVNIHFKLRKVKLRSILATIMALILGYFMTFYIKKSFILISFNFCTLKNLSLKEGILNMKSFWMSEFLISTIIFQRKKNVDEHTFCININYVKTILDVAIKKFKIQLSNKRFRRKFIHNFYPNEMLSHCWNLEMHQVVLNFHPKYLFSFFKCVFKSFFRWKSY
jgi:hypothetical protein